jgi:CHAT domain-containing protein
MKNSGIGNSSQAAAVIINLASIYNLTKKLNKAAKYFNKAIKIYRQIYGEHNPKITTSYLNLANLYFKKGKIDSAKYFLIKSINSNLINKSYTSLNEKIELSGYYNGLLLLESFKSLAAIYIYTYKKNKNTEALANANKFIYLSDKLISDLRKSYFTKTDKIRLNSEIAYIFDYAVEVSYWLYKEKIIPDIEAYRRIFYFMERNKTSTLLQSINSLKVQKLAYVPDSLINKENFIVKQINIYNQKLAESNTTNEENFYRDKLLQEQELYKNLINFYKKHYPQYYNAKFNVPVVSINQIQNFISDSTTLINYFIADSSLFALTISKDSVQIYEEKFKDNDIENLNQMNSSILSYSAASIRSYINLASINSKKLIFFNIPKRCNKLIIIPDGIISTVSFEALFDKDVKKGVKVDLKKLPYLIKDFAISYAYSATLLYETEHQDYSQLNRKDLLALAPVFAAGNQQSFNGSQIESIPGTQKEVMQIKSMFDNHNLTSDILLNKEANEYKLKNILSHNSYKIIHIATHGFVNFKEPELSALILSKDAAGIDDGILYSGEIYNLKLRSDLVTLSACETARGKISKGEGVIGLSRAFIYAGAKNLIISLWKVSDVSTTAEMTYFYSHLLKEYPKLDRNIRFSEALRRAKLDMINSKYSHPYFWSPFILIGR